MSSRFPILCTLGLLLAPSLALADVPNGLFEFDFSGGNQIFELTSIEDCDSVLGVEACIDVEMTPDGKGGHEGTAEIDFTGDIDGTVTGPAFAKIKGSEKGGKAAFVLETAGILEFNFPPVVGDFPTEVDVKCKGLVSVDGILSASCQVRVTVVGLGSEDAAAFFITPLEGGPWSFTMDVTPVDEKSFSGTGTDSLGNQYEVSGKYSEKKGLSNVKAVGLKNTPSSGAKIQLKNLDDLGMAESKFKVQGYKGGGPVQDD